MVDAPISDVRLHQAQHLLRRLRDLHEHPIVNLQQTEQLEDLPRFGRDLVDTANTNDEVDLRLSGDVEVTSLASNTLEADFLLLLGLVGLDIRFSTLEDDPALSFCRLRRRGVRTTFRVNIKGRKEGGSQSRKMVYLKAASTMKSSQSSNGIVCITESRITRDVDETSQNQTRQHYTPYGQRLLLRRAPRAPSRFASSS